MLFDCLDTDSSGNITSNELRTGLAELGMAVSESEIYALMETIDMDGNGDVDRDEFGSSSCSFSALALPLLVQCIAVLCTEV